MRWWTSISCCSAKLQRASPPRLAAPTMDGSRWCCSRVMRSNGFSTCRPAPLRRRRRCIQRCSEWRRTHRAPCPSLTGRASPRWCARRSRRGARYCVILCPFIKRPLILTRLASILGGARKRFRSVNISSLHNTLNKTLTPIPSREEILGVLRAAKAPLAADDLAQMLAVRRKAREGFSARLAAMARDEQIHFDAKGRGRAMPVTRFIAGRVQGHREGYGFLARDDGEPDLFLSSAQMQKVMHNDRVRARLVGYDRRGRPEGQIVEVIERAHTHLSGRLILKEEGMWLAPSDQRISQEILIQPRGRLKARAGQIVNVELLRFPDRYTPALGKVTEVLGEPDDPGIEIEIAVRKFGVPHQFSEEARAQAAQLPDAPAEADCRGRVDLRHLPWLTIDGEDARDFDDAVYGEAVKLGRKRGFRSRVAIADVSYYVKPGDALDTAALERSTSVYFPRRVIPMLPPELSNGLCSLNPEVDRCALVCDLVIDAQGAVHTYQFYPAMIHSVARLSYTEAVALMSGPSDASAPPRAAFLPQLRALHGIYQTLARARARRGAIDFDVVETAMICNAEGKIERIAPRVRNEAHKLIEECMLAANVCAADFLKRHQHPCLYRVHAGPSEEKLASLRRFLGGMGLRLGGGAKPQARDYAAFIAQARAARCADVAVNAAALIATGDIQPGQYWAFRPGVSRLYPLYKPYPALSGSARASRDSRNPKGTCIPAAQIGGIAAFARFCAERENIGLAKLGIALLGE